jgi:rhodanese-related sulfurtransferase
MAGHVPGALSNTYRDQFATWLGWLVPEDAPVVLVVGREPIEQVLDECMLVGYERFAGVLRGGMAAWDAAGLPVDWAPLVDATAARGMVAAGALALDVREPGEYDAGHIPDAKHIPLGQLDQRFAELPRDRPVVTYCGHGERSATGLSLLRRRGFRDVANFDGGFESWQAAGLDVVR